MVCVGEFPMSPEAEGIKSTRDNLSEATITPGPPVAQLHHLQSS